MSTIKEWIRKTCETDLNFFEHVSKKFATKIKKTFVITLTAGSLLTVSSCGYHLDDPENPLDQKAIKEEANVLLSSGHCDDALKKLNILNDTKWKDTESLILGASAYACKGGLDLISFIFDFASAKGPNPIGKLATSFPIEKNIFAHYINGTNYLLNTATPLGSTDAITRPPEANLYMVFLQLAIVGTLLNKNGLPDVNGEQTVEIVYNPPLPYPPYGAADNIIESEACQLVVSFGDIVDSYDKMGVENSNLKSSVDKLKETCNSIPGNPIPDCTGMPKYNNLCSKTATIGSQEFQNAVIASQLMQKINEKW